MSVNPILKVRTNFHSSHFFFIKSIYKLPKLGDILFLDDLDFDEPDQLVIKDVDTLQCIILSLLTNILVDSFFNLSGIPSRKVPVSKDFYFIEGTRQ